MTAHQAAAQTQPAGLDPAAVQAQMEAMQRLIEAQAAQMEAMRQEMQRLQSTVNQTQQELRAARVQVDKNSADVQTARTTADRSRAAANSAAAEAQQAKAAVQEVEQQTAVQGTQVASLQSQFDEQAASAPQPALSTGNDGFSLAISGQINRAFNVADDGSDTDLYFVDNDTSNSRIRFIGSGELEDGSKLGTTFELAFSPNNSYDVSQRDESPDDFTDVRKVEGHYRNDDIGEIRFGKGQSASDDVSEYDLSGSGIIAYSGFADPVGGLFLNDDNTGALSPNVTVGDVFTNFDGLGRYDRVSYITPNFGPLIQVHGSIGEDSKMDIALKVGHDYGDWTGVKMGDFLAIGGVAISDPNKDDVDYRLNSSASLLHEPTGISATFHAGMEKTDGAPDPYSLYAKLGYDTDGIVDWGSTSFALDYGFGEHSGGGGVEGETLGAAIVQTVDGYGVELYGQFRWFGVDSPSSSVHDYDDLYALTIGTRIKF